MPDHSTPVAPFRGRMVLCGCVSGLGQKRDLFALSEVGGWLWDLCGDARHRVKI